MEDHELLHQYARERSEPAFTELVRRHVDWVFNVCRRQVGDATLAQDVTQAVFIVLARKAASIKAGTPITSWLHRTARYASSEALRRESRRRRHERLAAGGNSEHAAPAPSDSWLAALGPELDAALARLSDMSREAVVQRFYAGRSFLEVSKALGVSEDAAKKRVSRALDELHGMLKHRLTMLNLGGLAAALMAAGAQAAPPALAAASVAAATTGKAAVATVIAEGVVKVMALAKAKFAAAVAAAVVVTGLGVAALVQSNQPAPPTPASAPAPVAAAAPSPPAAPKDDTIVLQGDPGFRRVLPRSLLRLTHDNPALPRFEASLHVASTPDWDMAQAQILVQRDGPSWAILVQTIAPPQRLYAVATPRFLAMIDAQNPGGLVVVDDPHLVLEFHATDPDGQDGKALTCDLRLAPDQGRIQIDIASIIALLQREQKLKAYDARTQSIRLGNASAAGSVFVPPQQRDGEPPISLLSISSTQPRMAVMLRDIRFNADASRRWVGFDPARLADAGMPLRQVTPANLRQPLVPSAAFWSNPAHGAAAARFSQWIAAIPLQPAKP